jgi:hypothetical protein
MGRRTAELGSEIKRGMGHGKDRRNGGDSMGENGSGEQDGDGEEKDNGAGREENSKDTEVNGKDVEDSKGDLEDSGSERGNIVGVFVPKSL